MSLPLGPDNSKPKSNEVLVIIIRNKPTDLWLHLSSLLRINSQNMLVVADGVLAVLVFSTNVPSQGLQDAVGLRKNGAGWSVGSNGTIWPWKHFCITLAVAWLNIPVSWEYNWHALWCISLLSFNYQPKSDIHCFHSAKCFIHRIQI